MRATQTEGDRTIWLTTPRGCKNCARKEFLSRALLPRTPNATQPRLLGKRRQLPPQHSHQSTAAPIHLLDAFVDVTALPPTNTLTDSVSPQTYDRINGALVGFSSLYSYECSQTPVNRLVPTREVGPVHAPVYPLPNSVDIATASFLCNPFLSFLSRQAEMSIPP